MGWILVRRPGRHWPYIIIYKRSLLSQKLEIFQFLRPPKLGCVALRLKQTHRAVSHRTKMMLPFFLAVGS